MKKMFLLVAVGLVTLSYAKNAKKMNVKKVSKVLIANCCTRSNTFGDVTATVTYCSNQENAVNCISAANLAEYEAEKRWRQKHLSAE